MVADVAVVIVVAQHVDVVERCEVPLLLASGRAAGYAGMRIAPGRPPAVGPGCAWWRGG